MLTVEEREKVITLRKTYKYRWAIIALTVFVFCVLSYIALLIMYKLALFNLLDTLAVLVVFLFVLVGFFVGMCVVRVLQTMANDIVCKDIEAELRAKHSAIFPDVGKAEYTFTTEGCNLLLSVNGKNVAQFEMHTDILEKMKGRITNPSFDYVGKMFNRLNGHVIACIVEEIGNANKYKSVTVFPCSIYGTATVPVIIVADRHFNQINARQFKKIK